MTAGSVGPVFSPGPVTGDDILAWLLSRQRWIERVMARRHLEDATLTLYDVSSSCLEGRMCPLAAFAHNRDGKQQIAFCLLCSSAECPIAMKVLAGNTARVRRPGPVGSRESAGASAWFVSPRWATAA